MFATFSVCAASFHRVLCLPPLRRKNPENEVEICESLSCENTRLPTFWSLPTLVCCVKAPYNNFYLHFSHEDAQNIRLIVKSKSFRKSSVNLFIKKKGNFNSVKIEHELKLRHFPSVV